MTEKSLVPNELIEALNAHRPEIRTHKTPIIYIVTVTSVIIGFLSLPFIHLDVSISSQGLLRPAIEISVVKIPLAGKIDRVFVTTNDYVIKDQVLVTLDSSFTAQQISFLKEEIKEDKLLLKDLHELIERSTKNPDLKSSLYRQSYLNFVQKIQDLNIHFNKAKTNYIRNRHLHNQKVISDMEFESHQFDYDKALNSIELLKQSQLNQWQGEFSKYEREVAEHEAQLGQLGEELENLQIKSPVSGTIENLASIYPGSQVFGNQDVAQVSPDTSLVAEIFVHPNDIGLLKPDMPVRFQVDAFNYNQWGLATGKVLEISNDIHIVNERPVFKARCVLDKKYLELKNGYKGYLKKGMTLQARFIVTERSLWQLLFDKVDDWLNPNLSQNPE